MFSCFFFCRVDDYGDKVYAQCLAMVDYDGTVFWAPIANLRSTCQLDLTFFPFDDQVCRFKGEFVYVSHAGLMLGQRCRRRVNINPHNA